MAQPYIEPLGFVDRPTEDGAVFLMTNPEDSLSLKLGTPITVWRYSPEHLALGKLRGRIIAIGYTTATFVIDETRTDPRWPEDEGLLRIAAPVFLAQEGTFEPDPIRKLTVEKAEAMRLIGRRYAELTTISKDDHPDPD